MNVEGLVYDYEMDSGIIVYEFEDIDDFRVEVNHGNKQFRIFIGDYYGMFYRVHYEKLVSVISQLEALGYTFQKEYVHGG
jgi:hypothetical protein